VQTLKNKHLSFYFVGKVFLGFVFLAAIVQALINIYRLSFNTWVVNESEIYKIDSFRLQGKAFYNSAEKYHTPSYEFNSTNGYSFSIDEKVYQGIIDKKKFADTFNYHELKYIAYSDKKTADLYSKDKKPFHINILQLQIGDTKYISTEKFNEAYKNKLIRNTLISAFLFLVILFTYIKTGKIFV